MFRKNLTKLTDCLALPCVSCSAQGPQSLLKWRDKAEAEPLETGLIVGGPDITLWIRRILKRSQTPTNKDKTQSHLDPTATANRLVIPR